ncbi:MAG: efflux RND transporter periplasmic adaptor subunit [Victivallaceae bacterium]|jgi:membrane fusion protein (multidrug efflux system)
MKKYTGILISLTSLIALLPAGCGRQQPGGQLQPPPSEVAVITIKTERATVSSELSGRTRAFLVAEVRPQVGGIIQKRLFEEGTDVKAGDLLYQLDPALYQAAYGRAQADLARTEAHAVPLRTKVERNRKLVKANAVSQQNFDDMLGELNTAEADIAVAKAALDTARINLTYTSVTAPISGRTGKSHVTVGALVTANHLLPLTTIQQINPIYVDVTQSSANYLRLRDEISNGLIKIDNNEKAKAKLSLEDGTPYPQEGEIKFRDVTVDPSTGSFILRMVFPNPENVLLPGMFVRAATKDGVIEQAILVPQQGVMRDMRGNPYALLVDSSDKVVQKQLELDRSIGNKWLVKSGLKPGDRMIVEGFQRIRPGAPVKVINFDSEQQQKDQAAKPGVASK